MASSLTSEAQIKSEIARLTASINQHKSVISGPGPIRTNSRNNTYINPNYKLASKYVRPTNNYVQRPTVPPRIPVKPPSTEVKDVVLNGIAFESSGRTLVRKDLPKPVSSGLSVPRAQPHQPPYTRKSGHLAPTSRMYKPTPSRGRRGRPANRNMTLNNTTRPYQARKKLKYSDKPCPRFTTTGNCSSTADSCSLSHDPTPERTPLCLHFLNKGRCTREHCPFPHVNVGARQGVCRDFAVLGYCDRGLDCDKQHVRECPDFAEKGTCGTKGCKLPHVIRANRTRKPAAKLVDTPDSTASVLSAAAGVSAGTDPLEQQQVVHVTANDAQLGDEYISLTFKESESESSDEESSMDEDEDGGDEEGEEGTDPTDDVDMEP
ncbi:hypothetical protein H0H81_006225 [Sphagnurus paluster]|uniref:C3H1-type domain-containing protein n=1 Tax=Sphagnurus paluster TaxID=117069 RepID=A0A9P7GWK5_9AGAR|nr:hypothetical protein H0H81_006225 [Sphagnurus paluster]